MLHEGTVSGSEEHSLSQHHPQRHQTKQLSLQQGYTTVREKRERERERENIRFFFHYRFQLVDFGLAHLESEKHGSHREQKGIQLSKLAHSILCTLTPYVFTNLSTLHFKCLALKIQGRGSKNTPLPPKK